MMLYKAQTEYEITFLYISQPESSHHFFQQGDAAFLITKEELNDPDIDGKLLYTDPLVVILPEYHPLADSTELNLSDLTGETFVTLEEGMIRQLFSEAGLRIPNLHIVKEPSSICISVAQSYGIALFPESVWNFQNRPDSKLVIGGVKKVSLNGISIKKQVYMYWKKKVKESEAFLFCRSLLDDYGRYVQKTRNLPLTLEEMQTQACSPICQENHR